MKSRTLTVGGGAVLMVSLACTGLLLARPAGKAWEPSMGTVQISGTVKFTGKVPKRKPVDMSAEAGCKHEEPPLDESVIVNSNSTLKNVFIWVKKGVSKELTFAPPAEPVTLEQKGCTYVPHVFGIMVGQPLKICNCDGFLHNIHTYSKFNEGFNFGQPNKGMETTRTFTEQEIMVKFKCDVHSWMGAWAGVVAHPFFAVSGDDGSFTLPKLPAGEYTVEAWHEVYKTKILDVKVADGESKQIEFTFEGK
ncbi:MAG: hypothetical protein HYY93_10295 [Planctomycetes bacterium]|nr:hypothetical protein [Planctomycetota bacterium]